MPQSAIEFRNVWKKFRRGEKFDSLRDLLPAAMRSLWRGVSGKGGQGSKRSQEITAREFWAVRDVDFTVEPGQALGIIGHNGAGKSTVLKLLSGILRPNRGSVHINGRLSALIEVSAGFHPDLTGRENIFLNGTILGMNKREIASKFDEIVEFSGLADFIDTPVKRYSSGMFARLGFAVAAHVNPDVLLVDEVLSVGDMAFQRRCMDKMHERLRSGVTVVFVSHNLHAVATLCGRVIVMDHGEPTFDGQPQEALSRYMLGMESKSSDSRAAVQLVSARLTGGDEQQIAECEPGRPLCLDLRLRFNRAVDSCTLSLMVSRATDGLAVFDMAAQECGLARRAYAQGEEVSVRLAFRAHLLRGLYSVGVNVFAPANHEMLLMAQCVAQMAVTETRSYAGLADLELSASCLTERVGRAT